MKKIINRGFTLIELLVVIAIIGILASIVLVSLNSARNKGKDTRVLSDVKEISTQIETEANSAGTYQVAAGNCVTAIGASGVATLNAASNNCATLNTDLKANNGNAAPVMYTDGASAATSFTKYAIQAALNTGYFCVDSSGNAKSEAAALGSGVTVCP